VTPLSDEALRALMRKDAAAGWRAFIDQYTPLLVGLIRRAGLIDRDEVMEVYVAICEQLSARGFERLKSQDAARGSIGGWLAVVARHAVVDWVRSRKGRRRLFQALQDLSRADQRVFELYYWDERTPSEIAELLAQETGEPSSLAVVLGALERVDGALTGRHRAELCALAVRSKVPRALEDLEEGSRIIDGGADPEAAARVAQLNASFERALAALPAEDAAIVRLKYAEGLSNQDVERALGVERLSAARLQGILGRLRDLLADAGFDRLDETSSGARFFERRPS
jgi:DNA-directed RNA polymerase specialized sigma24 family protein